MTSPLVRYIALGMCLLIGIQEVAAWGPRARKIITIAALQIIRQEFDDAFEAGSLNYESDLLKGAEDGIAVIRDAVPMNTDAQAVAAVNHQIQLLREAREDGAGSYFAYRMGVLSALISDIVLPYGVPFDEEQRQLKQRISDDLDRHISDYSFAPPRDRYKYLQDVRTYFSNLRQFYPDDMQLIRDDYTRGVGYEGFLNEAGQAYFQRSVEAVIDAWYTVFRTNPDPRDGTLSPSIVAWYYVDEVGYLLNEKGNMRHAERAYRLFEETNTNLMEAYERIGDLYYEMGSEASRERAVREWKIAQNSAGPQRARAAKKLSAHYIEEGRRLLAKADGPERGETDLQDALTSFQYALEYDQRNDDAADYINQTTIAIQKRRENYETQQRIIDKSLEVVKQAQAAKLDEDYATAVFMYDQATNILTAVTTDFRDLDASANDVRDEIRKSTRELVTDVLMKAERRIEEGDDAVDTRRFDDAIAVYSSIVGLVDVIPGEADSINAQRKEELKERAEGKIQEAREARELFEREQALVQGTANP